MRLCGGCCLLPASKAPACIFWASEAGWDYGLRWICIDGTRSRGAVAFRGMEDKTQPQCSRKDRSQTSPVPHPTCAKGSKRVANPSPKLPGLLSSRIFIQEWCWKDPGAS